MQRRDRIALQCSISVSQYQHRHPINHVSWRGGCRDIISPKTAVKQSRFCTDPCIQASIHRYTNVVLLTGLFIFNLSCPTLFITASRDFPDKKSTNATSLLICKACKIFGACRSWKSLRMGAKLFISTCERRKKTVIAVKCSTCRAQRRKIMFFLPLRQTETGQMAQKDC